MQNIPTIRTVRAVLFLSGVLVATACDTPEASEVPTEPQLATLASATLLPCPGGETRAVTGLVRLFGGVVSLGGTRVVAPIGAVLGAAEITIGMPASEHMRVDLSVNGQEHWQFLLPVTVTIDYSRCPAEAIGEGPVSVWLIDSETGELLQNMGGIDSRLLRRITFVTDHFSGYAIAN